MCCMYVASEQACCSRFCGSNIFLLQLCNLPRLNVSQTSRPECEIVHFLFLLFWHATVWLWVAKGCDRVWYSGYRRARGGGRIKRNYLTFLFMPAWEKLFPEKGVIKRKKKREYENKVRVCVCVSFPFKTTKLLISKDANFPECKFIQINSSLLLSMKKRGSQLAQGRNTDSTTGYARLKSAHWLFL